MEVPLQRQRAYFFYFWRVVSILVLMEVPLQLSCKNTTIPTYTPVSILVLMEVPLQLADDNCHLYLWTTFQSLF